MCLLQRAYVLAPKSTFMVHKYGSASYTQIKEALLIMYSVDDGVFMVYFALQFHCLFIAADTRQTH